ncbi:winged helix DNA-binding domain-containing protein [Actinomadura rayongensis]|uniref:Winged helix DNA-binding domain-containing protein n=1 Tax=Actinomadura rayongensis TaxID=1429076 RepID=A0A6I4WEK4_9ACTN|nr:winged helix DNA-binding domain-containing protein [Actinomadura rayongensis]MXQ66685.1 winged helix DNA-binding domain-containing protein [Actinomadura rayongensis]
MTDLLDRRALNRALLARQLLLERVPLAPLDAVEHLVGMQSQAPNPPYVGLWTRLDGFAFADLAALVETRAAVRILLMRGTIHLVSARDARALRPLAQTLLDRVIKGFEDVLPDALAAAREHFAEKPRSAKELREMLAERWPGHDATELARAVHYALPLVQVPPRGVWGKSGLARHTNLDTWLDGVPGEPGTLDGLVLRYLGAFGPATVRDAQRWSGLTGLGAVFDRLAPRLRRFRDADGRTLYDLPDAPRPDPDTPAPVRLVPDFDNLTLSHEDRSRVITEEHRKRVFTVNGIIRPTLLVDGFVHGMWAMDAARGTATVRVVPFAPLPDADAVEAEARRLLAAAHPAAEHAVIVEPV